MPLLPRSTVVDRPTLVDRDDEQANGAQQSDEDIIEELGDGDGPAVNGIRFEKGDYGVVAASNLVAVLSTAQTEGTEFQQAFMTSAIQMKEMANSGIDISSIARMSRSRGMDDLNVSQEDMQDLKLATQSQPPEQTSNEEDDEAEEVADSEDDEEDYAESDDADEDENDADDSEDEEADSVEDMFEDDEEEQVEESEDSDDGEETS